jgi:hypothetical protein
MHMSAGNVASDSQRQNRLRPRTRRVIRGAIMLAAACALSVQSTAAIAAIVSASSGGVKATLHVGTHHPRVNRPWPIQFTVRKAGRSVKASVSYEYLLGTQVVARRSHYNFQGHFSDVFRWPASAAGYPLTFRAVIVAGAVKLNLDYAVQVSR